MTSQTRQLRELTDSMLRQYGPLIGGVDLFKALGFRSAATFQRAVRKKTLKISIFDVPGRRGRFALTADVASWLAAVSAKSDQPVGAQESYRGSKYSGVGKRDREAKM